MFERHGVFSKVELESRAEIKYEEYAKVINIEALTMIDMAKKQIIPAVMKYEADLACGANEIKAAVVEPSVQLAQIKDIDEQLVALKDAEAVLEKVTAEAAEKEADVAAQARFYCDSVIPAMEAVRKPADTLEFLVDKEAWPFPSYGDLLFEV